MTTKAMSGSYQDFKNGDTANKIFKFRLVKYNISPSMKDSKGQPIVYVGSCPIPCFGIINEKNAQGQWTQRVIRYIPGESSIYKDEQSSDEKIPKKVFKNNFVNGFKTVNGTDRLLLEYMMKDNLNATNPNRKIEVQPYYELVDTDKAIKKAMADDEALDEAKYFCRKGEWDNIRALAMVLGVATNLTTEETRWNLRTIAERDPAKFLSLNKDPKTRKKYHVLQALEMGFLVKNTPNNSIAWVTNENQPIHVAVIGRDVIDSFVNILSSDDGLLIYDAIVDMIIPKSEKVQNIVIPTKVEMDAIRSKAQPNPMLKESFLTDDEIGILIDKALLKELVTSKGYWLTYNDKKFKGKDGLLSTLKSDEAMLKYFAELLS